MRSNIGCETDEIIEHSITIAKPADDQEFTRWQSCPHPALSRREKELGTNVLYNYERQSIKGIKKNCH